MSRTKAQRYVVENGIRQGRVLQGLSARTQLMRKRVIEGFDFDFKQTVKSLDPDDIVAFANSRGGGIVVCGIENNTSAIIGVDDSTASSIDQNKLLILNKAADCDPPIPVVVDVENLAKNKPIYVVNIPEMGELCSTKSGRYLKREDCRTYRISPTEIKARVLDNEAEEFTRRLEVAAEDLERRMGEIDERVFDLNRTVEQYEATLNSTASDIVDEVSGAVDVLTDATTADVMAKLDEVEGALSHEYSIISRYVRLVETLTTAVVLAVSESWEGSLEELLERADAEVIKRHSLASPESGGAGLRSLFEYIAKDMEEGTGKKESGTGFIQECMRGQFLLSKCPHCGVREYPFLAEAPETGLNVVSAAPIHLQMKCPKCGELVEHAEELITHWGW